MSSKVKSGAEKRRLKEKELFEKAGTNPNHKELWSFVKINDIMIIIFQIKKQGQKLFKININIILKITYI